MFDPTNGNIAYAALGGDSPGSMEGVFTSMDAGQTWIPANGASSTTLPLTNASRIVLALAPARPTTLYVSLANVITGGLLGFFKTTDGGTTWTPLTTIRDYCRPLCDYANVIAVHPTNPDVVYAGGGAGTALARSFDGGATWSTLRSDEFGGVLHPDTHALAFSSDGGKLYIGNDGGVYSTMDIRCKTRKYRIKGQNATSAGCTKP